MEIGWLGWASLRLTDSFFMETGKGAQVIGLASRFKSNHLSTFAFETPISPAIFSRAAMALIGRSELAIPALVKSAKFGIVPVVTTRFS